MTSRLLSDYQIQKVKKEEDKRFRLFLLAQFIHYGALFLMLLGGLFVIIFALKAIFSQG